MENEIGPHVILRMINEEDAYNAENAEDIAVCNAIGDLIVFRSFDEAKEYQETYGVSGRVVELPTF